MSSLTNSKINTRYFTSMNRQKSTLEHNLKKTKKLVATPFLLTDAFNRLKMLIVKWRFLIDIYVFNKWRLLISYLRMKVSLFLSIISVWLPMTLDRAYLRLKSVYRLLILTLSLSFLAFKYKQNKNRNKTFQFWIHQPVTSD